jgi:hypothetical protein
MLIQQDQNYQQQEYQKQNQHHQNQLILDIFMKILQTV